MVRLTSHGTSCDQVDPFETLTEVPVARPKRIGSYRIIHPIASGSMGEVFRAVNEGSHETVALKLLRGSGTAAAREKDRMLFMREMSVLSRLHHPRIVTIRDFGSIGDHLFMAMEYVKTIDLRHEMMACSMSQQVRLAAGIGCYMLAGLDHAHSLNIVHRDIKPANVLVYRNPRRGNRIGIKLADFGMSKDVRAAGLSGMTCEGEVRGTPAFMSPEHLHNSRDAGPSCDVYSTAAVLYYFLTGMVPHQEDQCTPVRLCRIVEGSPLPIGSRREDLPSGLCEVIDRALRPASEGRYKTAIDFNQALLEFTRKRDW